MENKRKTGDRTENLAAAYLERKGMRILERNYRSRYGEIDLIGRHGEYLVFTEVKYRTSAKRGMPEEAVGALKQRRICAVADYYRAMHKIPSSMPVRYDVVAILGEEIRWYQNAFPHTER